MTITSIGRRLAAALLVVATWCALWGEFSTANIVGGSLLAAGLQALRISRPSRAAIRPGPMLRFVAIVLADLIASTFSVAKEVLTPTDRTNEGIVGVSVPTSARRHLLLLVVSITLTPGTAVVDADPDDGTLYLHLLHVERREAVIAHVQQLAELACRALPHPADPEFAS